MKLVIDTQSRDLDGGTDGVEGECAGSAPPAPAAPLTGPVAKRQCIYFPCKMNFLSPKKDGSPNSKFFESPETMSLLDGVKSWLQKNAKKVSIPV